MRSPRTFVAALLLLVLVGGGLAVWRLGGLGGRGSTGSSIETLPAGASAASAGATGVSLSAGGGGSVASSDGVASTASGALPLLGNYGRMQPVASDANANVKSVAEARRTGSHPERLSPFLAATPFDRKAYEANPQAYLDIVEPGRAFQTAAPGKGVPVLAPVGSAFKGIAQGETTALRVKAPAGSPVTFTSFDLGAFQNKLPTITVRADGHGVAEAAFTGTPGTINDVHIVAGCPQATGQVSFTVDVQASATASVKR